MKNLKRFVLLGLLFAGVIHLHGEVFLLGPATRSAGYIPLAETLPGLEGASALFREKIRVNGKVFVFEIFRSGALFEDMVRYLQGKAPGFAVSRDNLRCTVKLPDGSLERLLIIPSPGRGPATVLRIAGPPGVPPVSAWPRELPELPPGARALQVIEIPGKKSVYGAFDLAGIDPVNRFRDVDSSLRANGFHPAANESSPLIGGRGDIYWNPQKKQLIWVTFDRSGRGSFYCKRCS